jgi:hypothetical protein
MTFLPEHDRDFFESKSIAFQEVIEQNARGVIFSGFPVPAGLFANENGNLIPCKQAELLVVVPDGYNDTALDSFYVYPPLYLQNGTEPLNTSGRFDFDGKKWQFWSRHQHGFWRSGIDSFETYLQVVREALRDK